MVAPVRNSLLQKQVVNEESGKLLQLTLSHQQRIDVIYLSQVHGLSYRTIANYRLIPFSTVRQTVQEYKKSTRTNKMHTHSTKLKLIGDRFIQERVLARRRQVIA